MKALLGLRLAAAVVFDFKFERNVKFIISPLDV